MSEHNDKGLGDAASGPRSTAVPSEADRLSAAPPIAIAPAHWPKVSVERWEVGPREIMSREDAAKEFGLPLSEFYWLDSPYVSGCGVRVDHPSHKTVRMFHTYTADDCVRDAAPDLLAALNELLDAAPTAHHTDPLHYARLNAIAAIAKATQP